MGSHQTDMPLVQAVPAPAAWSVVVTPGGRAGDWVMETAAAGIWRPAIPPETLSAARRPGQSGLWGTGSCPG